MPDEGLVGLACPRRAKGASAACAASCKAESRIGIEIFFRSFDHFLTSDSLQRSCGAGSGLRLFPSTSFVKSIVLSRARGASAKLPGDRVRSPGRTLKGSLGLLQSSQGS